MNMNNARWASIKILCGGAFFTAIIVAIAALELAVAVQFQFRDQVFYFGFPWPMDSELPGWATIFAMWCGAAMWLLATYVGWTGISRKSGGGLLVAVMAMTFSAAASIVGAFAGIPAFAVWPNAIIWIAVTIPIVGALVNDWEGFKIRYTG